MIVDCHTHISCSSDSVAAAEHLDACEKINSSFVLITRQGKSAEDNKKASRYVREQSKLVGFAAFNPAEDKIGLKNITSATKGLGLDGVVLYCSEDKFHPAHSRAMRFYESAEELGLPLFFHNGPPLSSGAVLDYAQPYLLDEVARKFPLLKIVIGSMGRPFVSQTLCMLGKHDNVYADLTINPDRVWDVYNIVLNAHEAGVMDKLLFGSGYPFAEPGNCIETLLGFNKLLAEASLPTVPREKIRQLIERDTLNLLGINSK